MKIISSRKFIYGGGALGIIFLGLLTNAIWDGLKPLTQYVFEILLNLSVLGMERFKDGIYIEIAKGLHEAASLEILIILHSVFLSALLTTVFLSVSLRRKLVGLNEQVVDHSHEPWSRWIIGNRYFIWVIAFYVLFSATVITLDLVRQKYINNAVTHFEQLMSIVSPVISGQVSEEYESSFSEIRNKEDYAKIIAELEDIARKNNKKTPEFSFIF